MNNKIEDMIKKLKKKNLVIMVGIILVLIIIAILISFYYFNDITKTITIEEKERVSDYGATDSYYLVWTTEGDVYKVDDCLIRGKVTASNTYGELNVGDTYSVTLIGWRIGLFSMYKNIIEVEEEEQINE